MARARLQSQFFAVSQRIENQNPRGDKESNSKPTGAINTKTHVIGATSCLLEGETQPPKTICLVDSTDLHRAWGHLQEAIDCVQVQSRKGGGTDALTKGILLKDYSSNYD